MWLQFYMTAAMCAAFLYVPGYLVLRGMGFARLAALPLAAVFDVVAYSLLAAVYPGWGIDSSWASLSLPVMVIGMALVIGRASFARKLASGKGPFAWGSVDMAPCKASGADGASDSIVAKSWFQTACLAAYLMVGVAVSALVFGCSLNGPDSFVQEYDNLHHMGVTYGYLQWGNWSSLQNTLYSDPVSQAIDPFRSASYYPSGWSLVAAMGAQVTGASALVANNAMNFCVTAVMLPVSFHCFMRVAFASNPTVVPFGAIVCTAFTAFPWAMLIFGPVYPNMMGLALLPVMLASFVAVTRRESSRLERVVFAGAFCLGIVSCVFTQPNAVFAAAALLIFYCVSCMAEWVFSLELPRRQRVVRAALLCVGFLLAVAAIWFAVYNLPFLRGVTSHNWPAFRPVPHAVWDILTLSYRLDSPQWLLAVATLVGVAVSFRKRRYLWMTFSWLLVAVIYVVDTTSDGLLKQVLSGFWYTDSMRVAALVAIAAMPLAALGLWSIARGVARCAKAVLRGGYATAGPVAAVCLFTLVAAVVIYCPDMVLMGCPPGSGAFPHMVSDLNRMNDPGPDDMYSSDEREFVQQVLQAIPEDALVINVPDDGSAFAYAADELNLYYRYLGGYGNGDLDTSTIIRCELSNIADNQDVRDAVAEIGAEYVLLLDQGESDPEGHRRRYLFTYGDGYNWQGLLSITDDTPGFEVVLAQGDMRLYRITATA